MDTTTEEGSKSIILTNSTIIEYLIPQGYRPPDVDPSHNLTNGGDAKTLLQEVEVQKTLVKRNGY